MTLRRKLLTVFIALAIMSLLSSALTIWSTFSQHGRLEELDDHYVESLTLHRVNSTAATLFRRYALSRVSEQPDGARRFGELDTEIRETLKQWKQVASSPRAERSWSTVYERYNELIGVLSIPPRLSVADGMPEISEETTELIRNFRELLGTALEDNERARDAVQKRLADLRQTVQLASTLSAFTTICLLLLLIGYVGSDIFAPLRELADALHRVARGEGKQRLDSDRDDELGAVNRAFNELAEGLDILRSEYQGKMGQESESGQRQGSRGIAAVRDELREKSSQLRETLATAPSVAKELETLCDVVDSLTALYFPLEFNPTETCINVLLWDVLAEFHSELSRRGASLQVTPPSSELHVELDRERVREALRVLIRAALRSSEHGAVRLELNGRLLEDGSPRLVLQVVDTISSESDDSWYDENASARIRRLSLAGVQLAREVAERHGGSLQVNFSPPHTYQTTLEIPVRNGGHARSRRLLAG